MPNYRRARTPGGTYFFTLVSYQRQKILCNDIIRIALRDAINTTRKKLPFTIDAMVLMPDHLHAVWTLPVDDGDYSTRWSMIKRLVTQRVGGLNGAHGAPYGYGGNNDNGAPQEYLLRSARDAPHGDDVDRGNGFVGCAVRTDNNIGRGDDFVGCAMRTVKRITNPCDGDDTGFVGCTPRVLASQRAVRTEELLQRAMRTEELPDNVSHHNENSRMSTTASRLKRREGAIWQRRFWEHQVRDDEDLIRCVDYLHWNPVKHGYVDKVADWPYSTFHRFVREGVYPQDWGGQGVNKGSSFGE